MSTSAPMTLLPDNIPLALRQGKRFTGWRSEPRAGQLKPAKMPYSPNAQKGASSTDPGHWVTFERAVNYADKAGLDGIMRAFDAVDGLVGIDLDNCRDPQTGEMAEWAATIVKRLDTYTEVSPSGTGVKAWVYGALPERGRKRGDVEMYDRGRFFTMTGHQLEGSPSTVGFRPDALLAIHREIFGDAPDLSAAADDRDGDLPALKLGDEDVIRLAAESKHNGARFRRLWDGDTSDYAVGGNSGASEADAGLCEILAYYGGPDPERIDRLYRRSGLFRDKWDRDDYRDRTIRLATQGKTRFYGDHVRPAAPVAQGDADVGPDHLDCRETNRLRGLLLDRDEMIEQLQACNSTLSLKLTHITELRALDRRMELDKQRIRRKLKPMQAESVIALAIVGPAMANSAGVDKPFVTGEAVARVAGGKTATVRSNLRVLDHPDSPVRRTTVSMGVKSLTAFDFAGMDTPDLLTALGDFAEALDAPPKLSPVRIHCQRCPEGTTQTVATICDGCRSVLQRRTVAAPPNVKENTTLAEDPESTVSVRTYREGKHHVAEQPYQPPLMRVLQHDEKHAVVPQPRGLHVVNVWRCQAWLPNGDQCMSLERYPRAAGGWRCDGCGRVERSEALAAVAGGSE